MHTSSLLSDADISRINDLIRINTDSAKGFRAAAELVNDVGLRTRFEQYATERDSNAAELRTYIAGTGEAPDPDDGTAAGTAHRWWMDLRTRFTADDSAAVLSEAERGEDVIKGKYEKAIEAVTIAPVSEVLSRQYVEVKRGHDTIRDLRDAAKNA